MSKILADTNIFVGLQEGITSVAQFFDSHWHFSFITRIELLCKSGITFHEEFEIARMLEKAEMLPFNNAVELETINLRRKSPRCKLPDAIIAATAMHYKMTLVTFDHDFSNIDGLDVIVLNYTKPVQP